MDPLSQAVLGAAVGEAGFRSKLGSKALPFGAVCGLLPDSDLLLSFFDEWATLAHHRGPTHSLLVLAAAAPVVAWCGYRLSRRFGRYRTWLQLSLWALITHALLDVCTTYGTVLLWPVNHTRFALDAVAAIDPAYTLVLLIGLLLTRWRRLTVPAKQGIAAAALCLSTAYLVLGYSQSQRAIELARGQLQQDGQSHSEIRAVPTFFNVWLWRVVARDSSGDLEIGYVSTWSPEPIEFVSLARPDDAVVSMALSSPQGRLFCWFAMDLVGVRVERSADGASVYLSDQRYGLVTQPTVSPFNARAAFDHRDQLLSIRRSGSAAKFTINQELAAMWSTITGNS